jgi:ankyrin repeat protein
MTSLRKLLEDKEFRESMDRCFFFPKRKFSAVLRTKPNSQAHVDFGAVGIAYDYCLRLAVMRTHNLDHDQLNAFPGFSYYLTRYQADRNVSRKMEPHLRVLTDYLSFNLSDAASLFRASLFLAKFDSEYRSGLPIIEFAVKPQDVEELARVVANSNLEWTMKKDVVLGPVFDRSGSKSAINADADLIIGTTLVDVKTSSRVELKANIRQLLGYYTLNKLADSPRDIDRLGVYYPRFDFFLEIPIRELLSESQEDAMISIFRSALGDNIDSRPVRNLPQFISSAAADAFLRDENGDTLLHHAVCNCNRAGASCLLKMGADVNAKNSGGHTSLEYAIHAKDLEMVILLINAGANVNTFDQAQSPPLLMAISYKQKKVAEMLLNAGADVNCQDDEGWTPLLQAVMDKQNSLVNLLIERGAKVDTMDKEGATPLLWAVTYKQEKLTEMLLNAGADVNCQDSEGWTPLHQAVLNRQKNLVDILIKHGAKADAIDEEGATPLSIASRQRNRQLFRSLRETSKNNLPTS